MRVGSTHKVRELSSPEFHRPLTGSKGVGRLSVQFLASELELTSVPQNKMCPTVPPPEKLTARVNWDRAVQAGELTQATAQYELDEPKDTIFPLGKSHGTTVRLKRLRHAWQSKDFEDLAGEVWFLQPPFRSLAGTTKEEEAGFEVALSSPDSNTVSLFNTRMSDILQLYRSRIVGKLCQLKSLKKGTKKRRVQLSLELERQPAQTHQYDIPLTDDTHCLLDKLEFEIRIFYLRGRQGYGIPVNLARNYMAQYGGVHIYDAGFRIPYAGAAADWLRLEVDHSHRLHTSRLLPRELHVPLGLNHLPTNSRVLGVVNIDTTRRTPIDVQVQNTSTQHLQIQVSRDRLVDNDAFHQLRDIVRYALDYYATGWQYSVRKKVMLKRA